MAPLPVATASEEGDTLDPSPSYRGGFEADFESRRLRMYGQPRTCSSRDAPELLGIDHLEWIAVAGPALLLHLDEDQHLSAPQDEIELVAPRTGVRGQKAVAPQTVVTKSAPLASVHAAE
jgi:hypothetical protein